MDSRLKVRRSLLDSDPSASKDAAEVVDPTQGCGRRCVMVRGMRGRARRRRTKGTMAWCRLANLDPAVVWDVLTFVCCRRFFFFFFSKTTRQCKRCQDGNKGSTTAQHPYVPMHCLATSHRTKHASRVQKNDKWTHRPPQMTGRCWPTNIKGNSVVALHTSRVSLGFGQVEWGEEGGRSRRM